MGSLVEHEPLGRRSDAVLGLIEGRQLRQHSVICEGHLEERPRPGRGGMAARWTKAKDGCVKGQSEEGLVATLPAAEVPPARPELCVRERAQGRMGSFQNRISSTGLTRRIAADATNYSVKAGCL